MQGDSSTPGPRSHRTVPTRDRGTAERSDDAGGRFRRPTSPAAFHSRARRLADPPGSLRSPVPPKGRTNLVPSSPSSPSSPFQGGRQRSEAMMQGDSSTPGPRSHRTVPTRDRGTAERSDAGGFLDTRTSQSSDGANEGGGRQRSEATMQGDSPTAGPSSGSGVRGPQECVGVELAPGEPERLVCGDGCAVDPHGANAGSVSDELDVVPLHRPTC